MYMDIVVVTLDLMHAHNFRYPLVNGVKMLLFLVQIIVHQCMLIIKKDVLVLCEEPTDVLKDTIITAEAKYSVNVIKQKKFLIVIT